jgi:hypothetical protein
MSKRWNPKAELQLNRSGKTGRIRLKVTGNPIVLALGIGLLLLVTYVVLLSTFRCFRGYAAYEGRVEAIEADWVSAWFGADGVPKYRVLVVTAEGNRIVRFIDGQTLVLNRIVVGDTIRKATGLFQKPHVPNKKTIHQYKQELESYK